MYKKERIYMPHIVKILISLSPTLGFLSLLYVIYLTIAKHLPFTLEASIYPKLKPDYLKLEKIAYLSWSIVCWGIAFCARIFNISEPIALLPQICIYALIIIAIIIYAYRVQARRKLNKLGDQLRQEEKHLKK